jgi:hypothetical protein
MTHSKSKFMKAINEDGREMSLEIDIGSGVVLSKKLLRKKKSNKPINVADDFMLGVEF